MLSILIPTFNHLTTNLVKDLQLQCLESKIIFEIIIYDDASSDRKVSLENSKLDKLSNVFYKRNKINIGRSAIRNKLAAVSKYKWLLFIDADVIPKTKNFVKKYLDSINDNYEVISGGIAYSKKPKKKEQILRWKYGKKRECMSIIYRKNNPYLSLLSSNFLIKRKIILKNPFNEKISKIANEDSIFSYDLKSKKIHITHIDNQVLHENLENSTIFLEKTLGYAKSSLIFVESNLIDKNYMKITRTYFTLKKLKITPFIKYIHYYLGNCFKKHLSSKNPSLFIFDFYRLSYICYISKD